MSASAPRSCCAAHDECRVRPSGSEHPRARFPLCEAARRRAETPSRSISRRWKPASWWRLDTLPAACSRRDRQTREVVDPSIAPRSSASGARFGTMTKPSSKNWRCCPGVSGPGVYGVRHAAVAILLLDNRRTRQTSRCPETGGRRRRPRHPEPRARAQLIEYHARAAAMAATVAARSLITIPARWTVHRRRRRFTAVLAQLHRARQATVRCCGQSSAAGSPRTRAAHPAARARRSRGATSAGGRRRTSHAEHGLAARGAAFERCANSSWWDAAATPGPAAA